MKENRPKLGKLILSATHLGNTKDTPPRLLNLLESADMLIFEESKPARQLLKTAQLRRNFHLFNEHRQEETLEQMSSELAKGRDVLYASDQGCPGVADPGADLAAAAMRLGAAIEVIPGPSSITAALSASPVAVSQFTYLGFLPREASKRAQLLTSHKSRKLTLVILDTPYRMHSLLSSCLQVFGKSQKALLSVDISGKEEGHYFSTLDLLTKQFHASKKLNFVLIIYL